VALLGANSRAESIRKKRLHREYRSSLRLSTLLPSHHHRMKLSRIILGAKRNDEASQRLTLTGSLSFRGNRRRNSGSEFYRKSHHASRVLCSDYDLPPSFVGRVPCELGCPAGFFLPAASSSPYQPLQSHTM